MYNSQRMASEEAIKDTTATENILERALDYISKESERTFREEVEQLVASQNHKELRERFYTDLTFGTGGLRGIIGGGSNRINIYTVERATQGLANYLRRTLSKKRSRSKKRLTAVIAYDSRRYSREFAQKSACVLGANGIVTYLSPAPRPTPLLSYAVRKLGAAVGIVVTASHNPPEYNGYKVYWSDGAQVLPPHDEGITVEARSVTSITRYTLEEALNKRRVIYTDEALEEQYMALVKSYISQPEIFGTRARRCKCAYTPLHGTGALFVERLATEIGIDCTIVPEQREPNGEFPTVARPNPEDAGAFKMVVELAKRVNADLAIVNDPDADRVGVAVNHNGGFRTLSGDQLGALLIDYILSARAKNGSLPHNPAIVKTIVTSNLQRDIALKLGATCHNTLTGFKHVMRKIHEFESMSENPQFVMGGEESLGYAFSTAVRDKDGIAAAIIACEMAVYYRQQNRTLIDRLEELYQQYGYYREVSASKLFPGELGVAQMTQLMEHLRATPPLTWGDVAVECLIDFQEQTTTNYTTGLVYTFTDLPPSNVLQYVLIDGSVVSVRPSGTEPKIKFYVSCVTERNTPLELAQRITDSLADTILQQINDYVEDFLAGE